MILASNFLIVPETDSLVKTHTTIAARVPVSAMLILN
jgi:hypothetical protein